MASSKLARRRQGSSLPKESPMETIHSDPSGLIKDKFNHVLMRTFKLEDLEMIKTIGTGTFARVFLCRPRAHLNRSNTDYYALKVNISIYL